MQQTAPTGRPVGAPRGEATRTERSGALVHKQMSEAATQPPLFDIQLRQHFWLALHFQEIFFPSMPVAAQDLALFAAASPTGAASTNANVQARIEIHRTMITPSSHLT
jgi:hypothetical protein